MTFSTEELKTRIEFLSDLPLYDREKPFFLHPSATVNVEAEKIVTTNVQWANEAVTVQSMRGKKGISLETNGFCYIEHQPCYLPRGRVSPEVALNYRKESEGLLRSLFHAEFTHCYDFKVSTVSYLAWPVLTSSGDEKECSSHGWGS
jgi:hypothetical protein